MTGHEPNDALDALIEQTVSYIEGLGIADFDWAIYIDGDLACVAARTLTKMTGDECHVIRSGPQARLRYHIVRVDGEGRKVKQA